MIKDYGKISSDCYSQLQFTDINKIDFGKLATLSIKEEKTEPIKTNEIKNNSLLSEFK